MNSKSRTQIKALCMAAGIVAAVIVPVSIAFEIRDEVERERALDKIKSTISRIDGCALEARAATPPAGGDA